MIGFIKRLFARRDEIANDVVRLLKEEREKYYNMKTEELLALPDEELLGAMWMRMVRFSESFDSERRALDNMDEEQKNFYTAYYYMLQMNAGGLCQYFANSSRESALFLSDALEHVGADEHRVLFESFLHHNKVATAAMFSFAVVDSEEYRKMEKDYPFEEFNSTFYAIEPLTEPLAAYVRENIGAF